MLWRIAAEPPFTCSLRLPLTIGNSAVQALHPRCRLQLEIDMQRRECAISLLTNDSRNDDNPRMVVTLEQLPPRLTVAVCLGKESGGRFRIEQSQVWKSGAKPK